MPTFDIVVRSNRLFENTPGGRWPHSAVHPGVSDVARECSESVPCLAFKLLKDPSNFCGREERQRHYFSDEGVRPTVVCIRGLET